MKLIYRNMTVKKFNELNNLTERERKIQILYKIFSFYVDVPPTIDMIIKYVDGLYESIRDHIVMHLKDDLFFATGVSILDSADSIYEGAVENGHLNYQEDDNDFNEEFDKDFGTEYKQWKKKKKVKNFNL